MNARQALFCTALVALTACGDTTVIEPTQITARVYVAKEITAQPYTLRVKTARETGTGYAPSETRDYASNKLNGYPVDLMIVPKKGGDLTKPIEVVVEARDNGNTVLAQERALARFVPNEQHVLELWLYPCGSQPLGTVCESNEACHGATCLTCVRDTCGPTPTYTSLPTLDPDAKPDPNKPVPANRGVSTSVDPATRGECGATNSTFQCDDGNPCNGKERCAPTAAGADENGCVVAEPAKECGNGRICVKETGACESCETNAKGDGDRDSVRSRSCGGEDCDDNDPTIMPGGSEICDGKDNDCNGAIDDATANASCAVNLALGVTATCEAGACVRRCVDPTQTLEDGFCVAPSSCPTPNPCTPGSCTGMGASFACVCGPGTVRAANGQGCREFTWRPAIALQQADGEGASPRIAMNATGNALALWTQPTGGLIPGVLTHQTLFARRFTAGAWEAGSMVESGNLDVVAPAVGVDNAGTGVAAFASGRTIRLMRAPTGITFGAPLIFEPPTTAQLGSFPSNLTLSVPATGPQQALWQFPSAGLSSHRSNSDGTGASQQPIVSSAGAFNPHFAANSAGTAAAVWLQDGAATDDDRTIVLATRFVQGVWESPKRIDQASNKGNPTPEIRARVGIDDAGNVLVAWGGAAGLIWTRFTPGGSMPSWPPTVPAPSSAPAANVSLAVRPSGEALAVWHVNSGDRTSLRASLFTPPAAWSIPVAIDGTLQGRASIPKLAVAASGAMVVAWTQTTGTTRAVYAATYLPGVGFRAPVRLNTGTPVDAPPDVAIADNGTAIAIWQETGTRQNIMAARLE